jgi:hypothetical protein
LVYTFVKPADKQVLGKQLPDLSQTPLLLLLSGFGFAPSVGVLSALYPSLKLLKYLCNHGVEK